VRRFLDLQVAGSNHAGSTFQRVMTLSNLFTRIYLGQPSLSSIRGRYVFERASGGVKLSHHETYAAKGEFSELTLARGRRLRSYFTKRHSCMSVTQCKASSGL